jgi:FkbM family methyltransferase
MKKSTIRALKGAYDRRRRALRQALLEPLLVGWPVLRDIVMNALSARGHLVLCELGDVRFFVDPADRVVGAWSMWHGGWQRHELERAIAVLEAAGRLRHNAIFVDVGANIGTHTVYALRSGSFARAVAFEPEPYNLQLLQMNVDINGFAGKATVVGVAAGAASGTATLFLHPRNRGAHALTEPPSDDGSESLQVEVVRVDEALAGQGVSASEVGLVWIDVEGYEPQVIQGLEQLMRERTPIAFEFSPQRIGPAGRADLVRLLSQYYSTMQILSESGSGPAAIAALASANRADDVLVY